MKYNSSTEFLPKIHLLRGQAQCRQIYHGGTSDYENLWHTYEAFVLKQMKFFDESKFDTYFYRISFARIYCKNFMKK